MLIIHKDASYHLYKVFYKVLQILYGNGFDIFPSKTKQNGLRAKTHQMCNNELQKKISVFKRETGNEAHSEAKFPSVQNSTFQPSQNIADTVAAASKAEPQPDPSYRLQSKRVCV